MLLSLCLFIFLPRFALIHSKLKEQLGSIIMCVTFTMIGVCLLCLLFVVFCCVYSAMVQFFTVYTEYQKVDFYITGEVGGTVQAGLTVLYTHSHTHTYTHTHTHTHTCACAHADTHIHVFSHQELTNFICDPPPSSSLLPPPPSSFLLLPPPSSSSLLLPPPSSLLSPMLGSTSLLWGIPYTKPTRTQRGT